jgi:hypothetical protein
MVSMAWGRGVLAVAVAIASGVGCGGESLGGRSPMGTGGTFGTGTGGAVGIGSSSPF